MIEKPKRLTVQQAAEWLEMDQEVLLRRVRAGKIKVIRDGRRYLFTEAEVQRYDKERETFA